VCPLSKRVVSNLGRQVGGGSPSLPLGLLLGAHRHMGDAFCDGRLSPLLLY